MLVIFTLFVCFKLIDCKSKRKQYSNLPFLSFSLLKSLEVEKKVSCEIEWYPIECHKTKTKVITLANHERCKQHDEPIKIQIHVTGAKRGKTRAAKTRLVLVLRLIG